MTDSTRLIRLSALKFFSGTLLSRVTGYGRDVALAYSFGTEPMLASFLVAFRFAHLARRLFGEGSLQNLFIPHFEELRAKNEEKEKRFFKDLTASIALLTALLALTAICVLFFFSAQPIALMTAMMLPSLPFICLFGLNTALLECEKRYFLPGIAPVAFNLTWIAATLFLGQNTSSFPAIGLSFAVVIACIAQWCVTLPDTLSLTRESTNRRPRFFTPEVRSLWKPLLLANIGVAASQINNALDPLFALFANEEGPAWLWYAIRVQQLPLALFGISLTSALLPPLSRAIKRANHVECSHYFTYACRKIALLTLPISCALFSAAPLSIALLFGHGAFHEESIAHTSLCLIAYGVGLFPMAYVLVAAPALYAFGDFKTAARASIYAMALNCGLNALFILGFGWSAATVALATSIAAFANLYLLNQALKGFLVQDESLLKDYGFILSASIAGLVAMLFSDYAVWGQIPLMSWLTDARMDLPTSTVERLMHLVREGVIFMGVTGGILVWRGFHKKLV